MGKAMIAANLLIKPTLFNKKYRQFVKSLVADCHFIAILVTLEWIINKKTVKSRILDRNKPVFL